MLQKHNLLIKMSDLLNFCKLQWGFGSRTLFLIAHPIKKQVMVDHIPPLQISIFLKFEGRPRKLCLQRVSDFDGLGDSFFQALIIYFKGRVGVTWREREIEMPSILWFTSSLPQMASMAKPGPS